MVRRHKHKIVCLVRQNEDDKDDWVVRYIGEENKTHELKQIIILTE